MLKLRNKTKQVDCRKHGQKCDQHGSIIIKHKKTGAKQELEQPKDLDNGYPMQMISKCLKGGQKKKDNVSGKTGKDTEK